MNSDPQGMVTCAAHGRSRLAKFCVSKPVLDAFGKVIRMRYECLDTSSCLKGNLMKNKEREDAAAAASNNNILNKQLEGDLDNLLEDEKTSLANIDTSLPSSSTSGMIASSTSKSNLSKDNSTMGEPEDSTKVSDVAKIITAGANRYYDLSRIGDTSKDEPIKKLCFICGQSGHERPKCPNVVCRKCRLPGCQGIPGVCVPHTGTATPCSLMGTPALSNKDPSVLGFAGSTIIASSSKPDAKVVDTTNTPPLYIGVRCTLCRQEGHVDCAHLKNPPTWKEHCIVCGRIGHHGFKCPSRRLDRWSDDMRRKFSGIYVPGGSGGYNNNYSNNNSDDSYRRGGGGGGGGPTCYNCGEPGHMSRDCPKPRGGGGGSGVRRERNYYNDDRGDDGFTDTRRGGGYHQNNNNNDRYGERRSDYNSRAFYNSGSNNNNNSSNYRGGGGGSSYGGGGGRRR